MLSDNPYLPPGTDRYGVTHGRDGQSLLGRGGREQRPGTAEKDPL